MTKEIAYLNHAGVAPISTRVEDALRRYALEATSQGARRYGRSYDREIERVRGRAAQLVGARPEEIAFVKNTTEGLGLVAAGLDWRRGDRVVSCDLEYPSNVYPWWQLAPRGVETVMLPGVSGRLPIDSIADALSDPRVRMLSLSSVEFGSGARNDLEAIGGLCRERGVLFCVDAIQSLGCFPLDVERCGIDFLAADGHKWLLSVEGCGVFFAARRSLELLTPRVVGWRSVTNNQDFDSYHMDLQPGAGRFEEGTPNTPGIFALGAAIDLLLEIGIDAVGRRVLELTDAIAAGVARRGATVLSPRDDGAASGIVAFRLDDEDPADTVRRLHEEKVFVVARRGAVRTSPHFYNDRDDLERLFDAL
ncbi:MAG: aminotransferase class V-fold PLP-dependent enzyme [Myxococcota bacterium]